MDSLRSLLTQAAFTAIGVGATGWTVGAGWGLPAITAGAGTIVGLVAGGGGRRGGFSVRVWSGAPPDDEGRRRGL